MLCIVFYLFNLLSKPSRLLSPFLEISDRFRNGQKSTRHNATPKSPLPIVWLWLF